MRVHFSRRLAMALSVCAALFLGSAAAASAYVLEGARWGGTPTSGCCANLHVQYASSMYTIDRSGWDNARAAWNGSAANVYLTNASGALTVNDSYASTVAWDGITSARNGCHISGPTTDDVNGINRLYDRPRGESKT
ncbi:hypothetical protein [Nostocoides sp. HKS02]|uniref:hypothetical protein n=1 Tax=Nostocoides sp. HKS02 TaxID=1813880 RepID=UPI0012B494D6|nr:hypothetical protein [Tetrasphaera sp. HKS02]QGN58599.1 hypothetical protein GKE56_12720 [Tetrasphaera sp. HKS02]